MLLSAGLAGTVLRLSMINVALFITSVALAAPHGITATALAGGVANMLCLPIYLRTLRRQDRPHELARARAHGCSLARSHAYSAWSVTGSQPAAALHNAPWRLDHGARAAE